jgi:hypothetical protein
MLCDLVLLVEDDDACAVASQRDRGRQADQAGAYDDDVTAG